MHWDNFLVRGGNARNDRGTRKSRCELRSTAKTSRTTTSLLTERSIGRTRSSFHARMIRTYLGFFFWLDTRLSKITFTQCRHSKASATYRDTIENYSSKVVFPSRNWLGLDCVYSRCVFSPIRSERSNGQEPHARNIRHSRLSIF